MEDINDEILVMEDKRAAIKEELNSLLETRANSSSTDEALNTRIHKSERALEAINEQLEQLYDIAVEVARAAVCEVFQDDYCRGQ